MQDNNNQDQEANGPGIFFCVYFKNVFWYIWSSTGSARNYLAVFSFCYQKLF